MASAISPGGCYGAASSPNGYGSARRSWRSARCGDPTFGKCCNSGKVEILEPSTGDAETASARPHWRRRSKSDGLVAQPAAQEAGHEGVAGAEHIIDHRQGNPGALDRPSSIVAGMAAERPTQPIGPRFMDDRRLAERAARLSARRKRIIRRRRRHQFFLGADDEIAEARSFCRRSPTLRPRLDGSALHRRRGPPRPRKFGR